MGDLEHVRARAAHLGQQARQTAGHVTDHDPQANPGDGVPDPWYGGQDGFVATANSIEAAIDGIFSQVRGIAAGR